VFALITFKIPGLDFITDYLAGAQAAANVINSEGGIGGHPVKLITCNSMLAPGPTTLCAHQTLGQHPLAEFGCETSWSAAGLEIYAAAGVPSYNCTNSKVDYTSPWSYGMGTGAPGEASAMAKYICLTMPNVKSIAYLSPADPEQEADIPLALNPIFKGCGKTISYTWIPFTTVDMTPLVTKVLQGKPGFVMTVIGQVQMVEVAKALQAAGYPTDQLSVASNALDKKNVLDPAGSAMSGIYASDEWTGWGLNDLPDVQAYQKATASAGVPNPDSGNVVQGYMYMMWFYTAAKNIGFAKFSPNTLASYGRAATNIPITMSRTFLNPGPSATPSVKQPYVQILRWKDNAMSVVTNTGQPNGWIKALG
jgi:branched-chain amino acid transport system substrate-binding protein